jgi:hypothetical protein
LANELPKNDGNLSQLVTGNFRNQKQPGSPLVCGNPGCFFLLVFSDKEDYDININNTVYCKG